MTEEFRKMWLEAMQEYSKALEVEDDSVEIITNPSDVDSSVSMPAVKLDADGRVEKYVQIRYATLAAAIGNAQTLLGQMNTDATTLRGTIAELEAQAESTREIIAQLDDVPEQANALRRYVAQAETLIGQLNTALQTAANDHSTAQSDHERAASDHTTATNDHTKVQGAENVNAELNGITVTITNRSGQSKNVDIGFDIYNTYTSVAAMNADASNVPLGKFVMIATTDKTSAENARMYIKSSQGNFRFLCDLDQASAEAWADWLNNKKPVIEQAATDANNAATNADNKAGLANDKAALADEKATYANTQGNYAKAQGDYAKDWNDHPPFIGNGTTGDENYWYIWNAQTKTYQKSAYATGDDLDWNTMTEEQKADLVRQVKEDLAFATVETCESIIDELI